MLNYKEVHKDKMESILYYLGSAFQQVAVSGWDVLSLRGSECVLCIWKKWNPYLVMFHFSVAIEQAISKCCGLKTTVAYLLSPYRWNMLFYSIWCQLSHGFSCIQVTSHVSGPLMLTAGYGSACSLPPHGVSFPWL